MVIHCYYLATYMMTNRLAFSAKRDDFPSNDVWASLAKPLEARPLCESLLSSTDERDTNEGR